jgi:hypothetical protein
MQPGCVDAVDGIPLTASDKVEKYKLRQQGVCAAAVDGRGLRRSAEGSRATPGALPVNLP